MTGRRPAGIAELAPIARAAVGRDLVDVRRLAAGSDGDFPDREFMLAIAPAHTERTLAYLS